MNTFFIFLGVLNLFNNGECQLGVVYSPFVSPGDIPDFTDLYTITDVKLMLNLLENDNFHQVVTESVGAPDESYRINSTRHRCTSAVHTALAAAEINNKRKQLVLSIYQGLFSATAKFGQRLNSEIEVAFEIVEEANRIYNGTVEGMVVSSNANFQQLIGLLDAIKAVSAKARGMNLKFGIKLKNCDAINGLLIFAQMNPMIKDQLRPFDFIICQKMPPEATYSRGHETFNEKITKEVKELQKGITNAGVEMNVMLETGWPSGMDNPNSNTNENMEQKLFLEMMGQWANTEKRLVFVYEGFDNPWKDDSASKLLFASHYGIWKHSNTTYERKGPQIQTHNLLVRQLRLELPELETIDKSQSNAAGCRFDPTFTGIVLIACSLVL